MTETTSMVVADASGSQVRDSLVRLDAAARARLSLAGGDLERSLTAAVGRIEARARAAAREKLRANAWLALGIAIGIGVLLGKRGPRR